MNKEIVLSLTLSRSRTGKKELNPQNLGQHRDVTSEFQWDLGYKPLTSTVTDTHESARNSKQHANTWHKTSHPKLPTALFQKKKIQRGAISRRLGSLETREDLGLPPVQWIDCPDWIPRPQSSGDIFGRSIKACWLGKQVQIGLYKG